jgi:hypothetical protein
MQLQQRYLSVQTKLDRAYGDCLAGNITEEMWTRKSQEWQRELEEMRREASHHESASADYPVTGSSSSGRGSTARAAISLLLW